MGSYPLVLGLLGAIWGASYLFIKIGVSEIGPLTFAMCRVFVGALVLLLIIGWRRERLPRDRRAWAHFAVMGILNALIPFGAISWGTQFIPSGLSAILGATMPLFTFVLATALGGESRSARGVLGMLVGFGGIVVLTGSQLQDGWRTSLWGQVAVTCGSLSYAAAAVYARRHLTGHSPLVASLGQVASGWVLLLPLALLERPWAMAPSWRAILALLALGILGTGIAYILYYRLIQIGGATAASVVTYITPVIGVFWGWIILGERLGWNAFLALCMILVSLILINSLIRPHQRQPSRQ